MFTDVWLPGTTEMTSRLFDPLDFGAISASSLLLAESLSADSEDEDGLLDSLGVFLSSAEKQRKITSSADQMESPWFCFKLQS